MAPRFAKADGTADRLRLQYCDGFICALSDGQRRRISAEFQDYAGGNGTGPFPEKPQMWYSMGTITYTATAQGRAGI